jgi:hypothetical protein
LRINSGIVVHASTRKRRINAVHPEHHGRVHQIAGGIAQLEWSARPGGEITVAGAVDEHAATDGAAP